MFPRYIYQIWWTSSHEDISFVDIMNNSKYLSSLLMEFIETFNIFLSLISVLMNMVLIVIVTVWVIWLGNILLLPGRAVDPWSCFKSTLSQYLTR